MRLIYSILTLLITLSYAYAQKNELLPDLANVQYGKHERNVLDIYFANESKLTPLAIYIHGGGFRAGSKEKIRNIQFKDLLNSGISVASINYRFLSDAPLPAAHEDAKLALQYIRSKSSEWNIDKNKIALFGGSAGAQICMWLAFSKDMANAQSNNLIEHESTRVSCVALVSGQTTMDIEFWTSLANKHLKNKNGSNYLKAIFGSASRRNQNHMAMYGSNTLKEANDIAINLSGLSLISADDPPVFMSYFMTPEAKVPRDLRKARDWFIHHVDFGIALKEKMDKLNIEAYLKYPDSKTKYESLVEFIVDKLLEK